MCPECGTPKSTRNLARHLRSHKWSDEKVSNFCTMVLKAGKSPHRECPQCKKLVSICGYCAIMKSMTYAMSIVSNTSFICTFAVSCFAY